jgi:hypothetical protein
MQASLVPLTEDRLRKMVLTKGDTLVISSLDQKNFVEGFLRAHKIVGVTLLLKSHANLNDGGAEGAIGQ